MRPKSLQELVLETEELCQRAKLTLLLGEQILAQIKETREGVAVLIHSVCAEVEQALFLEGPGALPCLERDYFGPVPSNHLKLDPDADDDATQAYCSTEREAQPSLKTAAQGNE